eukprot:6479575-Amphidinium_carterae.2
MDFRSTTSKTSTRVYNNYCRSALPSLRTTILEQKLTRLRQLGMEDDQIQAHEDILRKEKILELYIILPEKALEMWKV